MQGRFPFEYLHQEKVNKAQQEIFADLDAFSWEVPPGEIPDYCFSIVLLPPVVHEGRFVKGILAVNQGTFVLERWPEIQTLFHVLADSHFSSYAFCESADAVAGLYANPERERWFYEAYPSRSQQIIIPMQLADWTNERGMVPDPNVNKDIDFVCVARVIANKNLPFLARVMQCYHRKYGPARIALPNGYDIDWSAYTGPIADEWAEVESILGNVSDYFELLDHMPVWEMPHLYRRSKIFVLASLLEGKPRVIYEAQSCDVPVVCCAGLNHWYRGKQPVIAPDAGLLAPFDEEGFADAMYEALSHHEDFRPRQKFLDGFSGRVWTLKTCLSAFPYYAEQIPDFRPGNDPRLNAWLSEALEHAGLPWETWLFGREHDAWMVVPSADHGPWLQAWQSRLGV